MTTAAGIRRWAPGIAPRHALAILDALEATGTTLATWRLVVTCDRAWAGRRNRRRAERAAVWIGERYTPKARGGNGRREVVFLVPKRIR